MNRLTSALPKCSSISRPLENIGEVLLRVDAVAAAALKLGAHDLVDDQFGRNVVILGRDLLADPFALLPCMAKIFSRSDRVIAIREYPSKSSEIQKWSTDYKFYDFVNHEIKIQ
jgi:hypothetical protein